MQLNIFTGFRLYKLIPEHAFAIYAQRNYEEKHNLYTDLNTFIYILLVERVSQSGRHENRQWEFEFIGSSAQLAKYINHTCILFNTRQYQSNLIEDGIVWRNMLNKMTNKAVELTPDFLHIYKIAGCSLDTNIISVDNRLWSLFNDAGLRFIEVNGASHYFLALNNADSILRMGTACMMANTYYGLCHFKYTLNTLSTMDPVAVIYHS